MNFTTDSYYLIGDSHMYCQDYAYSGIIDNKVPYAIIADGCSSEKDTDVGARVLVNVCKNYIEYLNKFDRFFSFNSGYFLSLFTAELKPQWITKNSLTATIRGSFIHNDKLHLFHYGDGYSIIKDLDNNQIIKKILTKFESNAPYYLIYTYNEDSTELYKKQFVNNSIETENGIFNVENYLNDVNNFYQVIDLKDLPNNFSVSLMSDGIDSYSNDKEIDFTDEVTTYKNYSGEFVKRKLKRFVYDKNKEGLKHSDDLSLATITKRV